MSRFTEGMYRNARSSPHGMVTGEPYSPVRHTWREVHERARRIAGGLAAEGIGHGDAVGVLAGAPVEIAPTAQGLWMRGASLTMLHQPTPRTDFALWAEDTVTVIDMIRAKAVIVSDPFMAAAPILRERGTAVVTVEQLLAADPIDPVDVGEDDLALMQLTSGSTGSPKAVQITHRNIYSNAEAMFIGAEYNLDNDVIVSWLPLFHDMGMTGFLTVPMYFGAELVKFTPMDFLRDTLLWARLIDKYKGTMTAAPNFAYALLAKRLRKQAQPGEFDLSSLRWALSGAEQVDPADVEDLIDGRAAVRAAAGGDPAGLRDGRDDRRGVVLRLRRGPGGRRGGHRPAGGLPPRRPVMQWPRPRGWRRGPAAAWARSPGGRRTRQPVAKSGGGSPRTARRTGDTGIHDVGWFRRRPGRTRLVRHRRLGLPTENGHVVVCGRVKDVIIMGGRSIYPTDIERAAGRVDGVRPGGAVAVRLDAGQSRETFAVAVESNAWQDPVKVRRIKHEVARAVVSEVSVRPRRVVVLEPGTIPKTPSGKLRRFTTNALVGC